MKSVIGIYPTPYDQHPHNHDFNCAIVTEKKIYAYEDRKLVGYKYDDGSSFPYRSLIAGLKELNLKPKDVDKWLFTCPKKNISKIMLKQLFCDKLKACTVESLNTFIKNKLDFYFHHEAHINLAKNISGYDDSFCLSIDGGGDGYDKRNLLLSKFKNNKLTKIISSEGNTGLAGFHAVLTDAIGFGVDNGKTSGFASYGKIQKSLYKKMRKFFIVDKNKVPYFFYKRKKSQPNFKNVSFENFSLHKYLNTSPSNTNFLKIIKNYKSFDVAYTGEQLIKNLLVDFINKNIPNQKNNKLVCSGGLFHNVAINQYLLENLNFEKIFFTMSAGDGGLGLGLASEGFNKITKNKFKRYHKDKISKNGLTPFLGPSFSNVEIMKILKNNKFIKYRKVKKNINKKIVQLVLNGEIIGIFRGKAEYGPRSLGNGSIIADPRKKISKIKINNLIKRRDWFMPFAPAVTKEKYYKYFDKSSESLYMQTSPISKNNFKNIAIAGVHVDGTSRVQLVDKKMNKEFWEIINFFGKKTNCYSILNTSFNRHGISTIGHPQQAIDHLQNGYIDNLILGDFLVFRDDKKNKKKSHIINIKDENKLLAIHEKKFQYKIKKLNYKI